MHLSQILVAIWIKKKVSTMFSPPPPPPPFSYNKLSCSIIFKNVKNTSFSKLAKTIVWIFLTVRVWKFLMTKRNIILIDFINEVYTQSYWYHLLGLVVYLKVIETSFCLGFAILHHSSPSFLSSLLLLFIPLKFRLI